MAFPDSNTIVADLQAESGRIEANMSAQAWAHDKWWSVLGRSGEFPRGMNATINNVVWDRSIPNTTFDWTPVAINNGGPNNANPQAVTVFPASTTKSFTLEQGAVNSDAFSIHDAYLSLNFPEQLGYIVSNLENNVLDLWEDRWQDEYTRLAGHKIVATSGLPETGSDVAWPLTPATSQATFPMLESIYYRLIFDGGDVGLPKVMNMPAPYCFCGMQNFVSFKRNNTVFRESFQYAFMGSNASSPLINGLSDAASTKGTYSQFDFRLLKRPARWDFVGGDWVRRPFYETSAATIGTKAVVSQAYLDASHEDIYVFHPNVMDMLKYDPEGAYSNGVQFDSTNFYGKFKLINIPDLQLNIDGNTVFYRALLAAASKARLTNLGYVLRALRCDSDFGMVGCSNS